MAKKPPKRTLTSDEKKLWDYVTRNDRKLHASQDNEAFEISYTDIETPPVSKEEVKKLEAKFLAAAEKKRPKPNAKGEYAGIDANTAQRLRSGNYPIDGTLDLHGMVASKAHTALIDFIRAHHKRQSRCLLIITGKGREGAGVLKTSLPGWLENADLMPLILAFDHAKAKHGGSGAYYILLRRQR